ncbi:hypothetical protein ATANTOWER_018148 [Ataeniobius toweri]|uniref:Uncharacterized protein n=1 Tax=Ataeniobius toweri TaxID=208326 RepID=A0ABU7AQ59_9TELE|nr:hypothetical protein [Ataeniobius toweri]
MSAMSTVIPCDKLVNLQVRGYENERRITLPPVYTREFIPVTRSHIPMSETALWCVHTERGFCDRSGQFTCYSYVEARLGAERREAVQRRRRTRCGRRAERSRSRVRAMDELKNLNFFLNLRRVNQSGTGCGVT